MLTAATLLCLAPFLTKPPHVDDPLFFWAAKRIAAQPFDPYGFEVNWYLSAMPMAEVTKNPPGTSYFMALVGCLFGWSTIALHAAFLLPALGTVLGTWALARRLCSRPLLAGMLVLAAPGFVVSATTLMSDVPMVALWVVASALWIEGIEKDRIAVLAMAMIVATAGVLTKYPGAGVIALLAGYAVLRRGIGRWLVAVAPALLAIGAYQWWSSARYGQALLGAAVSYAVREGPGPSMLGVLVAVSFLGGTMLVAAPLALAVAPWGLVGASALVGSTAAAILAATGEQWNAARAAMAGYFGIFVAAGVAIVALAVRDGWRRRDATSMLLALWVVGILLFAGVVNWMSNVRSVLPAVPAAAILLARAADDRFGSAGLPAAARFAIGACVAVGLWVAWGDYQLARAQVTAADVVRSRMGGSGTVWFMGHWGFQLAMEGIGARPVDVGTTRFQAGDRIVVPANNTNVVPLPSDMPARREPFEIPLRGGTTISRPRGVGFYSSIWGPLPYRLDPPEPERFEIVEVLPP